MDSIWLGLLVIVIVIVTLLLIVTLILSKVSKRKQWSVDDWTKNVELHVADDRFKFAFPVKDGMHGVMKTVDGLDLGANVSASFKITGNNPRFIAAGATPQVRFYIWPERLYSDFNHGADLRLGTQTLTVRLAAENWSTVDGKPCTQSARKFEAGVENATRIGLVFGDWHGYAHGVHLDGPSGGTASFELLDFNP